MQEKLCVQRGERHNVRSTDGTCRGLNESSESCAKDAMRHAERVRQYRSREPVRDGTRLQ